MHKNNNYSAKTSKYSYMLNKVSDERVYDAAWYIQGEGQLLNKRVKKLHKTSERSYFKTEKELNDYYKSLGL
jgi:hypothetical protein